MMDKAGDMLDPRVQRTRKQIEEAFIALTVERGFAAVTVRDITKRAAINRSTFYRYYLDKYDLLEQYMDRVYLMTGDPAEDPSAETEDRSAVEDNEGEHLGPVRLLRHVQAYADFYRVMLGTKGDAAFTERFRQNTERRFRSWLQVNDDPNAPPLELRITCISYSGMGAIVWWLEHGQDISPEQLARWLVQLSTSIMGPFVKGG